MDWKKNKEKESGYLISIETKRKKDIRSLVSFITRFYLQIPQMNMNIFNPNQSQSPFKSNYNLERKNTLSTSSPFTMTISHYNCYKKGGLFGKDQTETLVKANSGS
jgi:hypothetical protein